MFKNIFAFSRFRLPGWFFLVMKLNGPALKLRRRAVMPVAYIAANVLTIDDAWGCARVAAQHP